MTFFHLFILAIVQGITEFLPISSSAHLVLVPRILGSQDQGLLMDVSVHVGTLLAVIVYFWRDLWQMSKAIISRQNTPEHTQARHLFVGLVIATLPVVGIGYLFHMMFPEGIRSLHVIAWTTLIFGLLLWWSDRRGLTDKTLKKMSKYDALVIGLAQILALLPGTSRSGVTMTMARFLGFDRVSAARFSLLLGIPTIFGAGVLSFYDLYRLGDFQLGWDAFWAVILSFSVAVIAIAVMMRWLQKSNFTPFVFYRLILGFVLLTIIYL